MFYSWLNRFLPRPVSAIIVIFVYSLLLVLMFMNVEPESGAFRYLEL